MGKLVCLNKEDGSDVWAIDIFKDYDGVNITWGITENLLIEDEKLFCTLGGVEANVIAVNKDNGELIWKCKANGDKSAYGSPLLVKHGNKKILITTTVGSIIGIDVSNGKHLWSYPNPNEYGIHPNTPFYKDGYLFCLSGYGEGGVMLKLSDNGNSVSEQWKSTLLDSKMGGFVYHNNRLYGSCDKQRKAGAS